MHYYSFNIGDYASHTQHLDPIEDIAYRRMIDIYYLNEGPLPESPDEVARLIRMRSHCEAIAIVLREFFTLIDGEWRHKRVDEEITKYKDKSEKARNSANARWLNTKKDNANALPTQSECNANHKPITNNHKPITTCNSESKTRFAEFWDVFADKRGRQAAEKVWKRKKLDNIADEVISGAAAYVKARGIDKQFWKQAQGWLNDGRWEDDHISVAQKPEWTKIPKNNDDLWEWAIRNGFSAPGKSDTYDQYRRSLQNQIERRAAQEGFQL